MFRKVIVVMCILLLSSQMFSFCDVSEIVQLREEIKSMPLELTAGDREIVYEKTTAVLDKAAIDPAWQVTPKITLETLLSVLEESAVRLEAKDTTEVSDRYGQVILLYLEAGLLTSSDVQLITEDYIGYLGKLVTETADVNQEQLKRTLEKVVQKNMHIQGFYMVLNNPSITAAELNAVMLNAEKTYRITTSRLNQYNNFKNLGTNLQRELFLGNETLKLETVLVADLMIMLKEQDYKITVGISGAEAVVSNTVMAKTTGDLKLMLSKTMSEDPKIPAFYNVQIGNVAFKEMVDLTVDTNAYTSPYMEWVLYSVELMAENEWKQIPYDGNAGVIEFKVPQNSVVRILNFTTPYLDIVGHWSEKSVDWLAARHVFDGVIKTEYYDPSQLITRGDFIRMLVNITGDNGRSDNMFTDVTIGSPYADIIETAIYNGFTTGSSNNMFYPDKPLTREDMAVLCLELFEEKKGYGLDGGLIRFKDVHDIAWYAKDAVKVMNEAGYISGFDDNTFRPKNHVTKAEAAALIYKMLK